MNRFTCGLLAAALVAAPAAQAEEHHHWTDHYGTRAALMGGAVIAGVRDTSATYYNPAALSFVKDQSLSISANAYRLRTLSIENGAGDGLDLESSKAANVPLLVSGSLLLGKAKLGYALLARHSSAFETSQRLELNSIDLLRDGQPAFNFTTGAFDSAFGDAASGSLEDFRGQVIYASSLDEYWAGLSWALPLTPQWSVGASAFGAYRAQAIAYSQLLQAVNQNTLVAAQVGQVLANDWYNVRGIAKLGTAFEHERLKLGATVTLPSVNLFGSGTVSASFDQISNPELFGASFVIDGRQEDLETRYKSPLSVALGAETRFGDTTLATAVEWFDSVDDYSVMQPAPGNVAVGITPALGIGSVDATDVMTLNDTQDDIVNVALAVDQKLNEVYHVVASFRTDRSTYRPAAAGRDVFTAAGYDLGIASWDNHIVTLGMTRAAEQSLLSVGVSYGFASADDFGRPSNVRPSNEGQPPTDVFSLQSELVPAGTSELSAHALSVLVGWTYLFK